MRRASLCLGLALPLLVLISGCLSTIIPKNLMEAENRCVENAHYVQFHLRVAIHPFFAGEFPDGVSLVARNSPAPPMTASDEIRIEPLGGGSYLVTLHITGFGPDVTFGQPAYIGAYLSNIYSEFVMSDFVFFDALPPPGASAPCVPVGVPAFAIVDDPGLGLVVEVFTESPAPLTPVPLLSLEWAVSPDSLALDQLAPGSSQSEALTWTDLTGGQSHLLSPSAPHLRFDLPDGPILQSRAFFLRASTSGPTAMLRGIGEFYLGAPTAARRWTWGAVKRGYR